MRRGKISKKIRDVFNKVTNVAVLNACWFGVCDSGQVKLENYDTITDKILTLLKGAIDLSGLVAVVLVIIAGVKYMTTAGDPEKFKEANQALVAAIVGFLIILITSMVLNFIVKLIA